MRYQSGPSLTEYGFTGQFSYTGSFGLIYFNARWLDVSLGRFAQADSIVPPGAQGLDRYAYANNSPMVYVDPSGHAIACYGDRFDDGPQCAEDGSPSKLYYDNWRYQETSADELFEQAKEDINDFVVFYEDVFSPSSGISLGKDIIQPNEGLCQVNGTPCWGVGELIDGILTVKEQIDNFFEGVGSIYKKYVVNAPTSIYTPTHYLQTQPPSETPYPALTVSPIPTPTGFTPPSQIYISTNTETPIPTKSPTLTIIPVTFSPTPTIPYVTSTYFP